MKAVVFKPKEIQIIKLICRQYSTREIGEKMGISHRTIEGCRERILEKTKAKNMVGIAIYAIKNGIHKI
ncbi:response regulator transcription factor [Sediminibacterium ginsengisoli]|nr:helix-turn-helix transcriptional regulator [Sediminibacterium ginsengisoli]